MRRQKTLIEFSIVLSATLISIVSGVSDTGFSKSVTSNGAVFYGSLTDVTVNASQAITSNALSLGLMFNSEAQSWSSSSIRRQLTADANFKIVRLLSNQVEPCTSWNELTKNGTFSWTNLDLLINRIFQIGAEPLVCLGYYNPATGLIIPSGMAVDPSTGLPHPDSFAAYCREWVNHYNSLNLPVRFYEIINEPWGYFGWNNYTRISYYMSLFNAAAQAMKAQNSNILIGFDGTNRKPVLTYWLANGGANLGFISFHKYDSDTIGRYSDATMLSKAETFQLQSDSSYYGVQDAQQTYYKARGKLIPVINSESNFNSAYSTGTDPKTQQMVGAVWTALVLRTSVLVGLNYNCYQCFSSSASWERTNKPSGGVGFGMINSDNNQPWNPYYVNWLFGTNLGIGDPILESSSSNDSIRTLAWTHSGKLELILISKSDQTFNVSLHGLPLQMNLTKIDNSISWQNPQIQTSIIDLTEPLSINGYTVLRLESM